jgi:hypothetical protein
MFVSRAPRHAVLFAWCFTIVLALLSGICVAVALAREHENRDGESVMLGYAALWTVALSVGVTIGGTLVMRRTRSVQKTAQKARDVAKKNELDFGCFVGGVGVMSQQCFVVGMIFLEEERVVHDGAEGASDQVGGSHKGGVVVGGGVVSARALSDR